VILLTGDGTSGTSGACADVLTSREEGVALPTAGIYATLVL
jgi:hypothetical protein